jgi:GntR family transcriptional regulator/MocR family aminotransferase
VLPEDLVPRIAAAKGHADWVSSTLDQLTLAEFITSGAYDRHVRSMRLRYRRRRDELVAVLAQRTPGIGLTGLAAGLQAVLRLPRGTEAAVVREAARRGLAVSGIAEFRHEATETGWRLPGQDALVVNYAAPSDSAWAGTLETLCLVLPGG